MCSQQQNQCPFTTEQMALQRQHFDATYTFLSVFKNVLVLPLVVRYLFLLGAIDSEGLNTLFHQIPTIRGHGCVESTDTIILSNIQW